MIPSADRGTKPVTGSTFYILLALADGPLHGLGIVEEIENRTDGEVSLGPGTLYHALRRLESEGLIVETDDRPDPELDDPRRRYHEITDTGREVVSREAGRLERLLEVARRKDLLPDSGGA